MGYLLKDRVFTDEQFTDALYTVARGGTVMDPEVVAKLLAKSPSQMTRLSEREREVLAPMAEGRSNSAIAQRLFISEKAVSKHCTLSSPSWTCRLTRTTTAASSRSWPTSFHDPAGLRANMAKVRSASVP